MLSGYKYLEIHNVISGGKRYGPMKRSRCEFLAKGDSVLKQEALRTSSGSRQGLFVPVPDLSVALSRRRQHDASGCYSFLLRESTGHAGDRCPHVKISTFP